MEKQIPAAYILTPIVDQEINDVSEIVWIDEDKSIMMKQMIPIEMMTAWKPHRSYKNTLYNIL